MMMCRFAARLIPPMIATGVAKMSGQGVATTSTASARIQSPVTATLITNAPLQVNFPTYTFTVRYNAAAVVDRSTLAGSDLLVTGPNGFAQTVTYLASCNSPVVVSTVNPPGRPLAS